MPINISTVPKKRITKSKKQEDAARVYKNNASGPDPNAPQPPFPDSDGTDNDAEAVDHATASPVGSASIVTGEDITPKSKKSQKDASYDRLEVNRLLSDLFPSNYMNEKLKQLETNPVKKANAKAKATAPTAATATTTPAKLRSSAPIVSKPDDAISQAKI